MTLRKLILITALAFPAYLSSIPPDQPITPAGYQAGIGTGFDVAWAQFNSLIKSYNEQTVIDYAEAGFTNARIRTHFDATPELLVHYDSIITHCIRHGVTPIVAYESEEAEENPTRENMRMVVDWWRTFSEYFQDHSYKLAFNLFIEVAHELGDLPYDTLNMWYDSIVPAIRETNPYRNLIFAPKTMYPSNLAFIRIPEVTGEYYFAEWHDYAGGPTVLLREDKLHKRWTTGTELERDQIGISIETANEWADITGKPTWMGAWMAGKFDEEDYYTPEEECIFGTHMVGEFRKYDMPWSSNAHHHYYDISTNSWIAEKAALLQTLQGYYLEPETQLMLFSECNYEGESKAVSIGFYDQDFMKRYSFENNSLSVKIPIGFVLETYSEPGFFGTSQLHFFDMNCFDPGLIRSFKFRDIRFTDYEIPLKIIPSDYKIFYSYPNPVNDYLHIRLENDQKEMYYQIFDLSGIRIRDGIVENNHTIYTGQLPAGIYLFRLNTGDKSFHNLIVKK
ncbi:MAG: T9SS type A sorting domain-containing protein [Bacteroidales bacterium]|nr:T9SS type A sorting domain-containing protein [Bacteroidales bacterium]MCF8406169.1 T9SS type A sorting domain-containing protein [Bacteroidales bacterium]